MVIMARDRKSKTRTEIYMRETTLGVKVISKRTTGYTMVMTFTPKQWEALKNSDKKVVCLKGGDLHDPEMEIKEYDEAKRCLERSEEN